MIDSIARIIRQLLGNLGLGSLTNGPWPIYVGLLPDQPDNAICVYDTAGTIDGRIMNGGEKIIHDGIQVRVRALDYMATRSKSVAIAQALDAQRWTSITVDGHLYRIDNISRAGAILPVGVEETDRKRHHFTINATTTIKAT